jgi:hypothetical protein
MEPCSEDRPCGSAPFRTFVVTPWIVRVALGCEVGQGGLPAGRYRKEGQSEQVRRAKEPRGQSSAPRGSGSRRPEKWLLEFILLSPRATSCGLAGPSPPVALDLGQAGFWPPRRRSNVVARLEVLSARGGLGAPAPYRFATAPESLSFGFFFPIDRSLTNINEVSFSDIDRSTRKQPLGRRAVTVRGVRSPRGLGARQRGRTRRD